MIASIKIWTEMNVELGVFYQFMNGLVYALYSILSRNKMYASVTEELVHHVMRGFHFNNPI